jgi:hypothetical protein
MVHLPQPQGTAKPPFHRLGATALHAPFAALMKRHARPHHGIGHETNVSPFREKGKPSALRRGTRWRRSRYFFMEPWRRSAKARGVVDFFAAIGSNGVCNDCQFKEGLPMKFRFAILLILAFACVSAEEALTIKWQRMPSLPQARRNLKAACTATKLHALGGYAEPSRGPEPSHFIFDFSTGSWSEGAVMPTARSNFALAAKGDRVFAIGGDRFLDRGEAYDALAGQWQPLPVMSVKRQHLFAAILDDRIYVPGGLLCWQCPAEQKLCNVLEAFDIKADAWIQLPRMPTARQNPLVSALDRKLYVMGGMDHDHFMPLVEIFDIERNTWTRGAPLPETKFYSGSVVFDGLILVLSGADAGDGQTSVLVYDPRRDQWARATPLPYEVKLAGFAVKGNELYVVGGCDPAFKATDAVYRGTILQ